MFKNLYLIDYPVQNPLSTKYLHEIAKSMIFTVSSHIPIISDENANASEQLSLISFILLRISLASSDSFSSWVLEEFWISFILWYSKFQLSKHFQPSSYYERTGSQNFNTIRTNFENLKS